MKTTVEEKIEEIVKIASSYRLVADRVKALNASGYYTRECAMGSGGFGHVKEMKDCYRVQIESGNGRWNYALVVQISKNS